MYFRMTLSLINSNVQKTRWLRLWSFWLLFSNWLPTVSIRTFLHLKFITEKVTKFGGKVNTFLMGDLKLSIFPERALLMLQSIKRALKLKSNDPRLHSCLVRFQFFFENNATNLPGPVKDVILAEGQEIFTFKTAQDRNAEFMQKHSSNLEHRVIGECPSW